MNDRLFLLVDGPKLPQHAACLGTLRIPDAAGADFVPALFERLRRVRSFAAPFNYRLRNVALRTTAPAWQVLADDAIDLDCHLRYHRLPDGGGQRALGELVSALHAQRLDWRRPLWEFHLIDGVGEGRFALYFKVHHALMDGVGGVQRFAQTVTMDPAGSAPLALWTVGPRRSAAGSIGGTRTHVSVRDTVRGLLEVRRDFKRNAKNPAEPAVAAPFAARRRPRTAG